MNQEQKYQVIDIIMSLHRFATEISIDNPKEGFDVRLMADDLAKIGNILEERKRS